MKVEDTFKVRTKATRTDRWADEIHTVDIDKANEVELTVYDKSGTYPTPTGMLWIRISDIAEEMRRKKVEADLGGSQWVTADKMENGGGMHSRQDSAYASINQGPSRDSRSSVGLREGQFGSSQPSSTPGSIDAWFALEPVGSIHLTLSFGKITCLGFLRGPEANRSKRNKTKIDLNSVRIWVERVLLGNVKRRCMNSTATSSFSSNSTISCAAPSAAISSNIPPACNVKIASIRAIRNATRKS